MSENFYLLLGLLIIILVISLVVLLTRKNIKQQFKFLGASWDMKTRDSDSSRNSMITQSSLSQPNSSEVKLGNKNQIQGDIGDVAGRDVIKEKSVAKPRESRNESSVNLGEQNKIGGNVGDVAGRDVIKKDKGSNSSER